MGIEDSILCTIDQNKIRQWISYLEKDMGAINVAINSP